MKLDSLMDQAIDKTRFLTLKDYIEFSYRYLDYVESGELQARIISQNESNYQFFQYRTNGYPISRPINSNLMYNADSFSAAVAQFSLSLSQLRDGGERPSDELRKNLCCTIYTLQQSIGATLDALGSGEANRARKINGDLFERLIRLLLISLEIDCVEGTVKVPVKDLDGTKLFDTRYQHDLILSKENELKVIGSVKTSSKDRLDKVFMDKFLYCKLTDTNIPHIAIFLNDVQRKKSVRENTHSVAGTFLQNRFRAFSLRLNSLDGIYYCDIRPNMVTDPFLSQTIKTIDHFFFTDLWELLDRTGQTLDEVGIEADPEEAESDAAQQNAQSSLI